jgi:glutamate-1-semialdehyde 2,1-aminomutase
VSHGAALFDRSQRVTPGGVHSPVRAFRGVGGTPIFFSRGTGARLVDVDGREYIDFCQSFGPLILGHHDDDVARAAREAIDDGWSFGACEPYSLELAEWIAARIPWAEQIRFVSSGTEAVMSALRIARAATGRSRIVKFEGCYHGHSDAMLVKAGSGLAGVVAASSAGVPHGTVVDTIAVPLDDDAALDRAVDEAGSDFAAAIVEPLPANHGVLPQRDEWLRRLADCTRRAGALLILDEVITGFRAGLQGMSGELGIRPDLVCYGKVMGGGFPAAAYAGRAELMQLVAPLGPVYLAGTLSANPVGMRAGLATLQKMDRLDGWRTLEARAGAFFSALRARLPADVDVVGHASIFWIRAAAPEPVRRPESIPARHPAWYAAFFHHALAGGVYLPPSPYEASFLSLAHDDATLAAAVAALGAAADRAAR